MKAIIDASIEFFNLPEEEKRRYEAKSLSDPIKSGVGTANAANHKILLWRDFMKSYVHPDFHCPEKPRHLRYMVSFSFLYIFLGPILVYDMWIS